MTRPLMDPDPTVPTRHPREPVQLSPATPVRAARALLAVLGVDAAVVVDGHEPIGVVTTAVLSGTGGRHPDAGQPIGEVMDLEIVRIDPRADEHSTLLTYQDAAWRSLLRRRPFAADPTAAQDPTMTEDRRSA